LLLGLRTTAGIDLAGLRVLYGVDLLAANEALVARLVDEGHVVLRSDAEGGRWLAPTLSGMAGAPAPRGARGRALPHAQTAAGAGPRRRDKGRGRGAWRGRPAWMWAFVAMKANALGSTRPARRSTTAVTASGMTGHSLSSPRRPYQAGASSAASTSSSSRASH